MTPDTVKMQNLRKCGRSLSPQKTRAEEIPRSRNAENADTKTLKMRKRPLTGFNVIGLR